MDMREVLAQNIYGLKKIAADKFRAKGPHMGGLYAEARLFGGQAVGQAFRAIQEQFGFDLMPSSMHYKFIGPGKTDVDLEYEVIQMTSGYYRVLTRQEGKLIGSAFVSLVASPSAGVSSTYDDQKLLELDYVEKPDELLSISELIRNSGMSEKSSTYIYLTNGIYELKLVEWSRMRRQQNVQRNIIWARIQPDCHKYIKHEHGGQAALTLSDFFIVLAAEDIHHNSGYRLSQAASLHHSVNFCCRTTDINPYQWMLYRVEAEIISNHRAMLKACVYDEQLRELLTITQEAYLSPKLKKSSL